MSVEVVDELEIEYVLAFGFITFKFSMKHSDMSSSGSFNGWELFEVCMICVSSHELLFLDTTLLFE